jgi:peptidyl-prolyl cis-trans isomerase B (cyclophilin B)
MRQAERRALASRRRRIRLVAAGAVVVVVGAGVLAAFLISSGSDGTHTATASATPTASASPTAATRPIACGAKQPAAPKKQTYAKEPALTIDKNAAYVMTMVTSCGTITIDLDAAKAPRTVNSFAFLASKGFFNGIQFSRTTDPSGGFAVLQGGDQEANGSGGPGYTLPDENLKGAKYTRGTIAMANGGANTGGSQFFLVANDSSALPASYTPFGKIRTGLAVLDKIIKIGNDGSNQAGGGVPKQRVYIDKLTVTKK